MDQKTINNIFSSFLTLTFSIGYIGCGSKEEHSPKPQLSAPAAQDQSKEQPGKEQSDQNQTATVQTDKAQPSDKPKNMTNQTTISSTNDAKTSNQSTPSNSSRVTDFLEGIGNKATNVKIWYQNKFDRTHLSIQLTEEEKTHLNNVMVLLNDLNVDLDKSMERFKKQQSQGESYLRMDELVDEAKKRSVFFVIGSPEKDQIYETLASNISDLTRLQSHYERFSEHMDVIKKIPIVFNVTNTFYKEISTLLTYAQNFNNFILDKINTINSMYNGTYHPEGYSDTQLRNIQRSYWGNINFETDKTVKEILDVLSKVQDEVKNVLQKMEKTSKTDSEKATDDPEPLSEI